MPTSKNTAPNSPIYDRRERFGAKPVLLPQAHFTGPNPPEAPELLVTETERERNTFVFYHKDVGIIGDEWALLIDLDDTTLWPHDRTGRIDISTIQLIYDKRNNHQGDISLGVITRIDNTSADVFFFFIELFRNSQNNIVTVFRNYAPSQIKLGVNQALPRQLTKVLAGPPMDHLAASLTNTTLNLLTPMDSPYGTATTIPGVGDVVAKYTKTAGSNAVIHTCFQIMYHGEFNV